MEGRAEWKAACQEGGDTQKNPPRPCERGGRTEAKRLTGWD